MDLLSHVLLNNLVFKELPLKTRWWPLIFGVAPDIIGFGTMYRLEYLKKVLFFNKLPAEYVPQRVFVVYNIAHSLVIWLLVFSVLYFLNFQLFALLYCGWLVHIVADIFTHSAHSSTGATKILWPLSEWCFPGLAWSQKKFLVFNYGLFAILYLLIYL